MLMYSPLPLPLPLVLDVAAGRTRTCVNYPHVMGVPSTVT